MTCRNQLQREGKPYPKSSCEDCDDFLMRGCKRQRQQRPLTIEDYNQSFGDTWVDTRLQVALYEFREEIRQFCKDYATDAFEALERNKQAVNARSATTAPNYPDSFPAGAQKE